MIATKRRVRRAEVVADDGPAQHGPEAVRRGPGPARVLGPREHVAVRAQERPPHPEDRRVVVRELEVRRVVAAVVGVGFEEVERGDVGLAGQQEARDRADDVLERRLLELEPRAPRRVAVRARGREVREVVV